jgi:hypothetical protein
MFPAAYRILSLISENSHCTRRHAVFLSGGWSAIEKAYNDTFPPYQPSSSPDAKPRRLLLHAHSLTAHDLLLSRCAAVLHHGGSGSAAAALAAGVPQVVVPLQFDQPFWAARLEQLGVAPPPLDKQLLLGGGAAPVGEAAATIAGRLQQAATSLEVRRACDEVAAALRVRLVVVASGGYTLWEATTSWISQRPPPSQPTLSHPGAPGTRAGQCSGSDSVCSEGPLGRDPCTLV